LRQFWSREAAEKLSGNSDWLYMRCFRNQSQEVSNTNIFTGLRKQSRDLPPVVSLVIEEVKNQARKPFTRRNPLGVVIVESEVQIAVS